MKIEIEELKVIVESRMHGIATVLKDAIVDQLAEVLLSIPTADRNTLIDMRGVHFVLPENCTAEVFFVNPMISDKKFDPMIPVWIISLNSELYCAPSYEFRYVVAHELAHVFFEHGLPGQPQKEIKEIELEADGKVVKWGFEQELKQTPYNYLYGSGGSECTKI